MADKNKSRPPNKPSRIDQFKHLVGTLTDAEVAEKAGVTSSAVHQYRQRHGIKPALPQGTTRRALERRKGSKGDDSGRVEQRLEAHTGELGKSPDAAVARKAGVNTSDVRSLREKLGIAAYTPESSDDKGGSRRSKIDDYRDLVGVLTDPEVALRAGVTRTAVQMYRKKHGIPPAGPPGDPTVARSRATPEITSRVASPPVVSEASGSRYNPPPPVVPASAPRPSGKDYAFKVTVFTGKGEIVRIANALDAAGACSKAASLGEVIGVERLGIAI